MFNTTSVDEVHIVFENCEQIKVPYGDIRYLVVQDIRMGLWDSNYFFNSEFDYELSKSAGYAIIHLKDKKEYHRVLQCGDIIRLYFYRHGREVDDISIRWTKDSGSFSNNGQKVELVDGEIHIKIDENVG
ncbi:MAG TPA: hypothetical protein VKU94_06725 [Geobacterales bacterium]|nr:hypothetical protein [Geobacterales bacterium]